jgi:hypothetical protein
MKTVLCAALATTAAAQSCIHLAGGPVRYGEEVGNVDSFHEEPDKEERTVLLARMNPDLAMGDELHEKTPTGNLFMVFGEPDLDAEDNGAVMIERLLRWFIFSVAIALMPLLFRLFDALSRGGGVQLPALLAHGELLLVTSAITAAGLGEVIGVRRLDEGQNLGGLGFVFMGGGCVITLMLSSWYFALVTTNDGLLLSVVARSSVGVFVAGLISAAGCVHTSRSAP